MQKCSVCQRDPERANNSMAECSHVDCPHRRRAWSDRVIPKPTPRWAVQPKRGSDPKPLDKELE